MNLLGLGQHMFLELITSGLILVHFGVPLGYYAYLRQCSREPWRLKLNCDYVPKTTIVIPTFDESSLIEHKLEDIVAQLFPREKLDIVMVDSGSTDGTADVARVWALSHRDVKFTLVKESQRKGKVSALNIALDHVSGDILVLTEADSEWSQNSLRGAVTYFCDDSVGAVTALKEPVTMRSQKGLTVEHTYRSYYNLVRIAESKIHSTPVFHGELAAFRTNLLKGVGGFRASVGADDSHTATLLALRGYRAIAVPEAVVYEFTPSTWLGYVSWKTRRALHLVQHFRSLLGSWRKAQKRFRKVLGIEIFLHVFNPWLLLTACLFFLFSIMTDGISIFHVGVISVLVILQLAKPTRMAFRTWVIEQSILIYGSLVGLFSRELVWQKIEELRTLRVFC
jgi:biofilm PGA synthesis N-glycosyltransferase PgaC